MNLTKEQQAILDGEKGDVLSRIMKTLIRYGELFGADAMVPVTGKYNHLVTSFGLKALKPARLDDDMTSGSIDCVITGDDITLEDMTAENGTIFFDVMTDNALMALYFYAEAAA